MNTSPLYSAPSASPPLDTLDIVGVGPDADVYRQGQAWAQIRQQQAQQSNSFHVTPLRRARHPPVITPTSATPGKKPTSAPFGMNLLPQTASSEEPSDQICTERAAAWREEVARERWHMRPINQAQVVRDKRTLDDFIAGDPGVDLDKP